MKLSHSCMNKSVSFFLVAAALLLFFSTGAQALSTSTDLGVLNPNDPRQVIWSFNGPDSNATFSYDGGLGRDSFANTITFELTNPLSLDISATMSLLSNSLALYGENDFTQAIFINDSDIKKQDFPLQIGGLVAGSYTLEVSGDYNHTSVLELGITAVPLPPAALLFGSAIIGFGVFARKKAGSRMKV